MLKILVCCGGGFSSSAMVQYCTKDLIAKGLDSDYQVEFLPIHLFLNEKKFDYDVVMLCPHLRYAIDDWLKKNKVDFPIYFLPPRIYGYLTAETVVEDALDVIELYKKTGVNPVFFPGEENLIMNKRMVSHRRHIKLNK